MRMSEHIIRNPSGQKIAMVKTDKDGIPYSYKTILLIQHQIRYPRPAFAYDESAIKQMEKFGVKYHVIRERTTNQRWCCSHKQFMAHCFDLNRGHGSQLALAMGYWNDGDKPVDEIEPDVDPQLPLF